MLKCAQTCPGFTCAASEETAFNTIGGGGGALDDEQDLPALLTTLCPDFRLDTHPATTLLQIRMIYSVTSLA